MYFRTAKALATQRAAGAKPISIELRKTKENHVIIVFERNCESNATTQN